MITLVHDQDGVVWFIPPMQWGLAIYHAGDIPANFPVPALRYDWQEEIGEEYCAAIAPHTLDWNALD